MCTEFNRTAVGPRVAAFRNDRARWNLANLFAGERKRIAELDFEIDRRAYAFAPADRAKQERARRAMTQAAQIALTGSYAK
ncbi:hypothetical protein A5746_24200 [Mycolicibacterium conceptionense]|uniref:Uncharacterized protein n=2 Tax=Mycolicibacterium senegalense TaxID=1796 RepID=A0ABR5FN30_9MYCO|nr:hypothetical protein [Mycolicibacterium conceptionense]KLI07889.1 hypothetical protein AA982_12300 [Mycolicibacterium senegalense]KLO48249.1 hypothetical protein ABW05_26435 [Mycolicibacterium senegalense]OBJ97103.1 hypothetical protein A5639_30755 [Mycolicibacterium conceptionense]OMB88583.1 hypothetical protein A5746_24200 [Mycolicibacterium conceptionense]